MGQAIAGMQQQLRAAAMEITSQQAALQRAKAAAVAAAAVGSAGGMPCNVHAIQQQQQQQQQQKGVLEQQQPQSPMVQPQSPLQQPRSPLQQPHSPLAAAAPQLQQPPMQLTPDGGYRPFMPLSALMAQRWGEAARCSAAVGSQNPGTPSAAAAALSRRTMSSALRQPPSPAGLQQQRHASVPAAAAAQLPASLQLPPADFPPASGACSYGRSDTFGKGDRNDPWFVGLRDIATLDADKVPIVSAAFAIRFRNQV